LGLGHLLWFGCLLCSNTSSRILGGAICALWNVFKCQGYSLHMIHKPFIPMAFSRLGSFSVRGALDGHPAGWSRVALRDLGLTRSTRSMGRSYLALSFSSHHSQRWVLVFHTTARLPLLPPFLLLLLLLPFLSVCSSILSSSLALGRAESKNVPGVFRRFGCTQ
jgi:hypothetical protein